MTDTGDKNITSGAAEFYLATVVQVATTGIRIQLDGQSQALEKPYRRIYTVRTGDRVLVLKMNGTFIVIGPLYPSR